MSISENESRPTSVMNASAVRKYFRRELIRAKSEVVLLARLASENRLSPDADTSCHN